MKKTTIIILVFILLCIHSIVNAQNATVTKDGNYIAVSTKPSQEKSKPTGKTFTDTKGIVYPVYVSAKGKLFYTRISKAGNEYKVYLKVN